MQRLATDKKGFTLMELMVAMLVLSIGMMAMLDGIANYVRINIDNSMRNEAIRISEIAVETLRNSNFDDVKSGAALSSSYTESRRFRNIAINYTVTWAKQTISANTVAVQVNVTWSHRNVSHSHDAASIISTDA